MKREPKFISIAFIAVLFTFLFGCNSPKKEFEKASKVNTIEAYNDFVKSFPEDSLCLEANNRIRLIEWQKISESDNIDDLNKFSQKYPNSNEAIKSKNKIQEIEFKRLSELSSKEEILAFIEKYPDSMYEEEVNKILKEVESSIATANLKKAIDSKDIKLLNEIADMYPETEYKNQALRAITKIKLDTEWAKLNTVTEYRNFYTKHGITEYFDSKKVHIKGNGSYIVGRTTSFAELDIIEMPGENLKIPGPVLNNWEKGTYTELGNGLALAKSSDKQVEVTLIMLPESHKLRKASQSIESQLIAVIASVNLPKNQKTYVIGSIR